ncbi:MAG: hypothetical protein FIA95_07375, partial [Gemmatimonadetes bacterium]|nr:hypothetical protein [Gemmatimonadota bacterium]
MVGAARGRGPRRPARGGGSALDGIREHARTGDGRNGRRRCTMEAFQVGGVVAAPGAKASGFLEVPGTGVRMPVTVVHGAESGPRILFTGGVHGGEYPGIEAAMRLARELDPRGLRGTVVVIHPVNVPAFHARLQYLVPQDGKNLNRQFPGRATGTVSERMAWTLMNEVTLRMDAWVDLHGGDIHEALIPFTIYSDAAEAPVVAASRAMAEGYGIEYVLASATVKGGTYSAAGKAGIPCILAEAGQLGQLDEDSVRIHMCGCHNVLKHLGRLPGDPEPVPPIRLRRTFAWRFSGRTACLYPAV